MLSITTSTNPMPNFLTPSPFSSQGFSRAAPALPLISVTSPSLRSHAPDQTHEVSRSNHPQKPVWAIPDFQSGQGEGFRLPLLKQGLTLAAGLSILMLIESRPARADLVICNQSGEKLSIATMYHKSSNDAWTANGWKNLDNNDCAHRLSFNLNETVYFHARVGDINGRTTHPLSGTTTSFCVDTEDSFEILWDGDNNNPYYKDLRLGGVYKPCENIHSDYKEVPFRKLTPSQSYDHCVVALGEYGSFASECFD